MGLQSGSSTFTYEKPQPTNAFTVDAASASSVNFQTTLYGSSNFYSARSRGGEFRRVLRYVQGARFLTFVLLVIVFFLRQVFYARPCFNCAARLISVF